ncbi:ribonuclease H-like domain-containing protein, partial [Tanacetum coccineum]
MLSASDLPLFSWAEAVATACYTKNRSLKIPRHEKTPYHIINERKPTLKFLHIFGCTCYIVRDGENLDKMKEKGDPCLRNHDHNNESLSSTLVTEDVPTTEMTLSILAYKSVIRLQNHQDLQSGYHRRHSRRDSEVMMKQQSIESMHQDSVLHRKQQQYGDLSFKSTDGLIPTTTIISNIKLPILKKEEYDIWAMEMEHYLEYIDNDVWKVIQNGNSKKRILIGKDGVVRILPPVTAAEIQAVEKERKAKNILLMAIPKEHMRRFHGMDDAKEIWEAIRTRFGGNANSKKMQKAVFKQQFKAFTISSSEVLEKGYDTFQQLLCQLEAHGAEVSTEDANHKLLRSLPPAWSNLAMTMRTKPDVDTLSIDDLYNNLRVFEQEIKGASKTSSSAQNVAFVSQSKSSTNKVKSGLTSTYSTCTPSTSSTNTSEKEALAGFADEIDDLDIEEMDINWQIAMITIRMKKFYKKTGRRVRVDGKAHVSFDKKKLECFNCHNTGHFARDCTAKGTHDG